MARTLTPEDYFQAAFDHLAEEGFLALKQAPLCARLGVTTGSFYRHFENWQDFRSRLLQQWYLLQTASLAELISTSDDPWVRVDLLRQGVLEIPRRAEAAIRAWSIADPEVAEVQRKVDDQRVELSRSTIAMIVGEEKSLPFALAGMYALIGWESLDRGDPENLDYALRLILDVAVGIATERGGPLPPTTD